MFGGMTDGAGKLASSDPGAVCREGRREASPVDIDIWTHIWRSEAAIFVACIVSIGYTGIPTCEHDADALETKFHPFMALSLLVGHGKSCFDLIV